MKKIYSLLNFMLIASIALIGCKSGDSLGDSDGGSILAPSITEISASATSFTFKLTAPTNSSQYGYVVAEGEELESVTAVDILDKTLSASVKSIAVYDTENLSSKEVYIGSCTPGTTYYIYVAAVSGTSYSSVGSATAEIISEDAPTVALELLDSSPYGFAYSIVPSDNTYKFAYAIFEAGTQAPEAENFFNGKIENSATGSVTVLSLTQAPNGVNSANVATSNTEFIAYAAAVTEAGTYSQVVSLTVGTDLQVTIPMADGVDFVEGIYNISYSKTDAATEDNGYYGVTNENSGEPFECRLFKYVSGVYEGEIVNLFLLQAKWFNLTMESNDMDDGSGYLEPYLLGIQTDNIIVFNGMIAVMGTDSSDSDTYGKLYVAADSTGTEAASAFGAIIAYYSDGSGLGFYGGGYAGMESIVITIDENSGKAKEITDLSIVHLDTSSYVNGTYDIVLDGTLEYVSENDPDSIPDTYEDAEDFFGTQPATTSARQYIAGSSYLHKISSATTVTEKVTIIK